MRSARILAFVLAGGKGTRLHPLTAEHAKPALPLAGGYRIVDFVRSNLVHSGIRPIYVLAQYKPQSLLDHVRSAWDMKYCIDVVLPGAASGSHGYQISRKSVLTCELLILVA